MKVDGKETRREKKIGFLHKTGCENDLNELPNLDGYTI